MQLTSTLVLLAAVAYAAVHAGGLPPTVYITSDAELNAYAVNQTGPWTTTDSLVITGVTTVEPLVNLTSCYGISLSGSFSSVQALDGLTVAGGWQFTLLAVPNLVSANLTIDSTYCVVNGTEGSGLVYLELICDDYVVVYNQANLLEAVTDTNTVPFDGDKHFYVVDCPFVQSVSFLSRYSTSLALVNLPSLTDASVLRGRNGINRRLVVIDCPAITHGVDLDVVNTNGGAPDIIFINTGVSYINLGAVEWSSPWTSTSYYRRSNVARGGVNGGRVLTFNSLPSLHTINITTISASAFWSSTSVAVDSFSLSLYDLPIIETVIFDFSGRSPTAIVVSNTSLTSVDFLSGLLSNYFSYATYAYIANNPELKSASFIGSMGGVYEAREVIPVQNAAYARSAPFFELFAAPSSAGTDWGYFPFNLNYTVTVVNNDKLISVDFVNFLNAFIRYSDSTPEYWLESDPARGEDLRLNGALLVEGNDNLEVMDMRRLRTMDSSGFASGSSDAIAFNNHDIVIRDNAKLTVLSLPQLYGDEDSTVRVIDNPSLTALFFPFHDMQDLGYDYLEVVNCPGILCSYAADFPELSLPCVDCHTDSDCLTDDVTNNATNCYFGSCVASSASACDSAPCSAEPYETLCVETSGGYECTCPAGYYGPTCSETMCGDWIASGNETCDTGADSLPLTGCSDDCTALPLLAAATPLEVSEEQILALATFFAIGDVNGDGNDDIVAVTNETDTAFTLGNSSPNLDPQAFSIYVNDGAGSFSLNTTVSPPNVGGDFLIYSLSLGDIDGDGILDIVYIRSRDVNFARWEVYGYEANYDYEVFALLYNTDGVTDWSGAPSLLYDSMSKRRTASSDARDDDSASSRGGTFYEYSQYFTEVDVHVAVGDLNGDGLDDVAIIEGHERYGAVDYSLQSFGNYHIRSAVSMSSYVSSREEIVLVNNEAGYEYNSTANVRWFTSSLSSASSAYAHSVLLEDVVGDSRDELFIIATDDSTAPSSDNSDFRLRMFQCTNSLGSSLSTVDSITSMCQRFAASGNYFAGNTSVKAMDAGRGFALQPEETAAYTYDVADFNGDGAVDWLSCVGTADTAPSGMQAVVSTNNIFGDDIYTSSTEDFADPIVVFETPIGRTYDYGSSIYACTAYDVDRDGRPDVTFVYAGSDRLDHVMWARNLGNNGTQAGRSASATPTARPTFGPAEELASGPYGAFVVSDIRRNMGIRRYLNTRGPQDNKLQWAATGNYSSLVALTAFDYTAPVLSARSVGGEAAPVGMTTTAVSSSTSSTGMLTTSTNDGGVGNQNDGEEEDKYKEEKRALGYVLGLGIPACLIGAAVFFGFREFSKLGDESNTSRARKPQRKAEPQDVTVAMDEVVAVDDSGADAAGVDGDGDGGAVADSGAAPVQVAEAPVDNAGPTPSPADDVAAADDVAVEIPVEEGGEGGEAVEKAE